MSEPRSDNNQLLMQFKYNFQVLLVSHSGKFKLSLCPTFAIIVSSVHSYRRLLRIFVDSLIHL